MHSTNNQCGHPVSGKMLLSCERMEKPQKVYHFYEKKKRFTVDKSPLERPLIVSSEAQLSANRAL